MRPQMQSRPQSLVKQTVNEIVMRGGRSLLTIGVFHTVEGNHAITRHSADATPIIDVSHGNNA